ncbi:MFS transporter [Catenuloplanes sp. NPDC051500]|uniref:MFS transporter n=1 Tax=Catenuloplanes sp. NPDC051500 TaxID=3363959 RepID=UPI0037A4F29A
MTIEKTQWTATTARTAGALAAMGAGAFCFVAMETLPVGLLPLIAGHYRVSLPDAGLLVTGYGLTVAVVSVPLAWLFRAVPRRLLLSVLLAVFAAATVASALAPTYPLLLGARVVVALSQSVFWAVVGPAAAGLVSAEMRGRAASIVFGGSALAPMLGVPAGTWLGQTAGWQTAFYALAALGLIAFVLVAALMPASPPRTGAAAAGALPSARRYRALTAMTVLSVGGLFAAFTFTTPFLTEITGLDDVAIGPVLLLRGLTGLAGVIACGLLVDRRPDLVMIGSTALQAASLLGMWALAGSPVAVVACTAVSGFALGTIGPALTARVLVVAPRSVDMAAATNSAAFNLGIAGGSYLGGAVLTLAGLRPTALVGGLVVLSALALAIADPVLAAADAAPEAPAAAR